MNEELRNAIHDLKLTVDLYQKRLAAKALAGALANATGAPQPTDEQIDNMTAEELDAWADNVETQILPALPPIDL